MFFFRVVEMATARKHDGNGWYEIEANPLSKTGIFEYLGSTINAPEPDRIYKVYRPESELSNPACIESFQLLPWVVDHDMLGEGEMSAEKKGVEGIIGQDVFYEDGYLKGNIKVFSDRLSELIETGMKELSLGYKCKYDFTPGKYNGEPFDAIQRDIRGNHLATVEEGRMGKEVAVLDQAVITFDSRDFVMATKTEKRAKKETTEQKPQAKQEATTQDEMDMEGEPTLSDMSAMVAKLMPLIEEVEKLKSTMNGGAESEKEEMVMEEMHDEGTEEDGEMMDMDHDEGEDMEEEGEDEETKEKGMDGLKKQLAAIQKDIKTLKKQPAAMDSKSLISEIHQRDNLASRLSHYVGVFDHSTMTAPEVARYGVKKLGIPCDPGNELAAMSAYLHNRQPAKYITHGNYATDSAEDFLSSLFEGA